MRKSKKEQLWLAAALFQGRSLAPVADRARTAQALKALVLFLLDHPFTWATLVGGPAWPWRAHKALFRGTEFSEFPVRQMAVVQDFLSGIWPTLAKKCNAFASSFAKLSRSLFSREGQLGASTWIPTFERPHCILGLHMGVIHNYFMTE